MALDAIIISKQGVDSLSGSNPLRLSIGDTIANIQTIKNLINNKGKMVGPVEHDTKYNWESAPTLNGIFLYSYLKKKGISVALINNFTKEKKQFFDLLKTKPRAVVISSTFVLKKQALSEMIQEIKQQTPDIPIIICTGYSDKINEEKISALGTQGYIMKPVIMREIAAAIREVLDNPGYA